MASDVQGHPGADDLDSTPSLPRAARTENFFQNAGLRPEGRWSDDLGDDFDTILDGDTYGTDGDGPLERNSGSSVAMPASSTLSEVSIPASSHAHLGCENSPPSTSPGGTARDVQLVEGLCQGGQARPPPGGPGSATERLENSHAPVCDRTERAHDAPACEGSLPVPSLGGTARGVGAYPSSEPDESHSVGSCQGAPGACANAPHHHKTRPSALARADEGSRLPNGRGPADRLPTGRDSQTTVAPMGSMPSNHRRSLSHPPRTIGSGVHAATMPATGPHQPLPRADREGDRTLSGRPRTTPSGYQAPQYRMDSSRALNAGPVRAGERAQSMAGMRDAGMRGPKRLMDAGVAANVRMSQCGVGRGPSSEFSQVSIQSRNADHTHGRAPPRGSFRQGSVPVDPINTVNSMTHPVQSVGPYQYQKQSRPVQNIHGPTQINNFGGGPHSYGPHQSYFDHHRRPDDRRDWAAGYAATAAEFGQYGSNYDTVHHPLAGQNVYPTRPVNQARVLPTLTALLLDSTRQNRNIACLAGAQSKRAATETREQS